MKFFQKPGILFFIAILLLTLLFSSFYPTKEGLFINPSYVVDQPTQAKVENKNKGNVQTAKTDFKNTVTKGETPSFFSNLFN